MGPLFICAAFFVVKGLIRAKNLHLVQEFYRNNPMVPSDGQ